FREAVEEAMTGSISGETINSVVAALGKLGDLTVNGQAASTLVGHYTDVLARIGELDDGREPAVWSDLNANGPYGSFTNLSVTLGSSDLFREAVEEAMTGSISGET